MTYTYSIFYIILSGSQANSLVFGQSVLLASTPEGTVLDPRLQKLFSILLIAAVCQLQAFSRINYVRFANAFAVYKITFLSIVSILGLCALRNQRAPAAQENPYGIKNLNHAFAGTKFKMYPISIAMLDIFRVYSGYENANFVSHFSCLDISTHQKVSSYLNISSTQRFRQHSQITESVSSLQVWWERLTSPERYWRKSGGRMETKQECFVEGPSSLY